MNMKRQKIDHTPSLGPDELAVYDAIANQAQGRDHCLLNLSAIQELTGLPRDAVLQAIDTLAENGEIRLGLAVPEPDNAAAGP